MTEQVRTTLRKFVERTKKISYNEGYEEGFSDGYEKGLTKDVMSE